MSSILTWIVLVAAAFTALGFLIKKIIIPGYKGVGVIEDSIPVFNEFTRVFKGKTDVFKVIDDIAAQFRTDSGSSLRDAIDQLCQMAETNRVNIDKAAQIAERVAVETQHATQRIEVRFEAQRQLDEQKAHQAERMLLQNDRTLELVKQMMTDRAQIAANLTAREKKVDEAAGGVASDLTERQRQIDEASTGVASDLARSRQRADEVPGTEVPGTAADEASKTPPVEEN